MMGAWYIQIVFTSSNTRRSPIFRRVSTAYLDLESTCVAQLCISPKGAQRIPSFLVRSLWVLPIAGKGWLNSIPFVIRSFFQSPWMFVVINFQNLSLLIRVINPGLHRSDHIKVCSTAWELIREDVRGFPSQRRCRFWRSFYRIRFKAMNWSNSSWTFHLERRSV